ncbi:hypothetical protein QSV08_17225 [Maribacter sp. BPC-D8]|uniref:hypothetical protein n=1 Tax=Maribacter sp. BPC-D8 TaxID=3053613 RepID=UPI002B47DAB7|nr:hypothetical protein [Maribacter sp. BPC-D8]WRI28949.1 hypothetical protein QSV08_17225 [Maribacter sp. BPC-D8]
MNSTIEIRNKPKASIIFHEDKFEIIDSKDIGNNGFYLFDKLLNIDVIERKTDWFITIISFIVDIFTGSASGSNYKNKAHLKIDLEEHSIKIWLSSEDIDKAHKAKQLLNEAILNK